MHDRASLLRWDDVLAPDSAPGYFVVCPEEQIDTLVAMGRSSGTSATFRIMRGKRCRTRDQLFQEFAAALQFPYYFGWNWDAFRDCLDDLEDFSTPAVVAVVTNLDQVLPKNRRDFEFFMRFLMEAAENLPSGTAPPRENQFRVVFHGEAPNAAQCRKQLQSVAAAASVVERQIGWLVEPHLKGVTFYRDLFDQGEVEIDGVLLALGSIEASSRNDLPESGHQAIQAAIARIRVLAAQPGGRQQITSVLHDLVKQLEPLVE